MLGGPSVNGASIGNGIAHSAATERKYLKETQRTWMDLAAYAGRPIFLRPK